MRTLLAFLIALSASCTTTSSAHADRLVLHVGEGWTLRAHAKGYGAPDSSGPTTGRFLSLDPAQGSLSEPLSTQGFVYGRANPTFFTDPDGRTDQAAYKKCLKQNGLNLESEEERPTIAGGKCLDGAEDFGNFSWWNKGIASVANGILDGIVDAVSDAKVGRGLAEAREAVVASGGEIAGDTFGGINNQTNRNLAPVNGMGRLGGEIQNRTQETAVAAGVVVTGVVVDAVVAEAGGVAVAVAPKLLKSSRVERRTRRLANEAEDIARPRVPFQMAGGSEARSLLHQALERQGLQKVPTNGFKKKWSMNGIEYEVRAHAAEPAHGKTDSIYRVSRRQSKGSGWEYADDEGGWHHTSTLKPSSVLYDPIAAEKTHIQLE